MEPAPTPRATDGDTVLVTGASSPLGAAVLAALWGAGRPSREAGEDLTDPAAVAPLLDGVGAIVHLAPLALAAGARPEAPAETLDGAARGTHVLLSAALERGIERVVLGSTLATMDAYPDDLEVTEQWRPRPRPRPAELAPYLAELTAREFTRDVQLERPPRVVCLRFAPDLAPADGAGAVLRALESLREGYRGGHRWRLYHIAPLDPGARYTSAAAVQALGYGQPSGAPAGGAGQPSGAVTPGGGR